MATEISGISIVIPVGPQPEYMDYLGDCIDSIEDQISKNDEIIIINDMAEINPHFIGLTGDQSIVYNNDWLLGCADSWNRGIALAKNEWCIMMGSDDKLLPGCLDICRAMIQRDDCDPLGYYGLTIETSEGEVSDLLNNAALVSKSLWQKTGGFPPTASVGAPDALLISIMIRNLPQHLHQLNKGEPLYWVRSHPNQETGRTGIFWPEIIRIRDVETGRWEEPTWTK
jgi:glycosyl transferase family 2